MLQELLITIVLSVWLLSSGREVLSFYENHFIFVFCFMMLASGSLGNAAFFGSSASGSSTRNLCGGGGAREVDHGA